MPAPDSLEASQRRLYLSLKNEISLLEIGHGRDIRAYERSYRASLPQKIQASNRAQLQSAIHRSQVVLVGDFHPFRQSQKGFIRLLASKQKMGEKIAVALECIQHQKQAALDSYAAGHITIEELKEEIDYENEWPFPWQNYREILEFAKKNGMRLVALNIKERNRDPRMLKLRDEAAAKIISQLANENSFTRIFVLYGELHLGANHLPKAISSQLPNRRPVLVVHQNESSLYWRSPKLKRGLKPEILKLGPNEFCIQNSVPWVKLQSYFDWLEGNSEGEEEWQSGQDFSSTVFQLGGLLAETLGVKEKIDSDLEILGGEMLLKNPSNLIGLTREEKFLFRHSQKFQRVSFLPVKKRLILPSASTNALTEAASILLWNSLSAHSKSAPGHGSRLVMQFLLGFLGSKILNPKRKCNEIVDMRNFLVAQKATTRRKTKLEQKKAEVFRRALALLDYYFGESSKFGKPLLPVLEIESSRLAGYVLANRIFLAVVQKPKLLSIVRKLFGSSNATDSWADHAMAAIQKEISLLKIVPSGKNENF